MTLILNVYTRDGIIVREFASSRSIYGTWEAVLKDITNMKYFKNILIKVY